MQENKIQIKEGECNICLFIDTDSEKETKYFEMCAKINLCFCSLWILTPLKARSGGGQLS